MSYSHSPAVKIRNRIKTNRKSPYLGGGGGGSLDLLGISRGLFGVLAEWPAPLWSVNRARGSKICDNRRDLSSDIVTHKHKHNTIQILISHNDLTLSQFNHKWLFRTVRMIQTTEVVITRRWQMALSVTRDLARNHRRHDGLSDLFHSLICLCADAAVFRTLKNK